LQAVGGAALTPQEAVDEKPARIDTARHRRALRWFVTVVVLVIAVDLVVKQLTTSYLANRDSVRLLGGAIYLLEVRNSGAAFSLGRNYTFIFPIVATVVTVWIIWMARRLASLPWAIALGLVLGGAWGNLGDRIFRAPGPFVGHVVDMISVFGDNGERFAVFNIADASLTCGVILAVLLEITGRRRDGLPKDTKDATGG
jgi:signal peptidase II